MCARSSGSRYSDRSLLERSGKSQLQVGVREPPHRVEFGGADVPHKTTPPTAAVLARRVLSPCLFRGGPATRWKILIGHQSRHPDQRPSGTRSVKLPGCGHIPDDPPAVATLITTAILSSESLRVASIGAVGDRTAVV